MTNFTVVSRFSRASEHKCTAEQHTHLDLLWKADSCQTMFFTRA